jgi:hypothetical protein
VLISKDEKASGVFSIIEDLIIRLSFFFLPPFFPVHQTCLLAKGATHARILVFSLVEASRPTGSSRDSL